MPAFDPESLPMFFSGIRRSGHICRDSRAAEFPDKIDLILSG